MIKVVVKLRGGRLSRSTRFWCGLLNTKAHYYVNRAEVNSKPLERLDVMEQQRNAYEQATQTR